MESGCSILLNNPIITQMQLDQTQLNKTTPVSASATLPENIIKCICTTSCTFLWVFDCLPLCIYTVLLLLSTLQEMEHKFWVVTLFCLLFLSPLVSCQLNYRFYDATCPNLTRIVQSGVWSAIANDSRIAASLLRLHFHDCFVNVINLSSLISYIFTTSKYLCLPNYNH